MTPVTTSSNRAWTGRTVQPAPAGPLAPEESGLLDRLKSGDADAYEQVVRAHGGRLLAVARRFLRHEEEARDAVQEAFLSAFQSIGRFHGESTLSTWLHRITINACLMRLRRAGRRPEVSIEELLPRFDEHGRHVKAVVAWPESGEDELLRAETRRRVRGCIDRLPRSYREVVLLRDIEELSTDEAARLLEISPNAVKIRLHRARQALRTMLAPADVPVRQTTWRQRPAPAPDHRAPAPRAAAASLALALPRPAGV